jgi:hypothetical protein
MPSKRQETNLQTTVVSDCRHHWIIDYSQQTESKGRCRLCGEERTFLNKMSSPHRRSGIAVEAMPLDGDISSAEITSGEVSSSEPDDSIAEAL